MKLKPILLLSLLAGVAALTTGCATHKSLGNRHTTVLGGLVEVEEGAYRRVESTSITVNASDVKPGAKLTGNRVSVLWGLFTFQDK
jgi:hypothetical protein